MAVQPAIPSAAPPPSPIDTHPIDNSASGTSGEPQPSPVQPVGQGPSVYTQDHPSIASTQQKADNSVGDVVSTPNKDAGMDEAAV